jgi:MvaI/BcnI restriction endonuclease family
MSDTVIYTKESLILRLREIRERGWIPSGRHGNDGGVGNTLEDLLGLAENNLPIPNAAEWELKCQRLKGTSLTTLFHMEPSPTALKFVPSILLPQFGWRHREAGGKYPDSEMSFRQRITATGKSDRGFGVVVNRNEQRVEVVFDKSSVGARHSSWVSGVPDLLDPFPYWGFQDLFHKAGTKLHNCFFVGVESRKIGGKEQFLYSKILKLSSFSLERFLNAIEAGDVLVDFDARSGHNHGTKFRFRRHRLSELYEHAQEL